MARLPRPVYFRVDSLVMHCGKAPEQIEEDLRLGVARVGGWLREPSYFESYLYATQTLIEKGREERNLDDLGVPAFYLQRHTLELLLKSVLSWLYCIDDLQKQLVDPDFQPDVVTREKALHKHNHRKLLEMVLTSAAALKLPRPPIALTNLVERFSSLESTDTWARYSTSRAKGRENVEHLKDEVVIPLVELQASLEEVAAIVIMREVDDPSYENALASEWEALNIELDHRGR
ncbi:hypothetical protein ALO95_200160 [Pseudomonas syringae pv. antirrhini]|uniref:hypothetical protein n=1 Tax=Pseudomonas syringae group genomosp. 3 TaxID=251701 RepID=UPI000EFA4C3F|nr:hypothetical protein [Pseudomonas syringae group genomosp. 3]RMP45686.1 hypothetical protein ALQ23_200191 [Pseudomonas syringae pv. antirrhini]RMW21489.1 hypothetical protein ALO95_200160 [Pseudomonas syringae pv. antirrhini]